jgi:hypothetical protein
LITGYPLLKRKILWIIQVLCSSCHSEPFGNLRINSAKNLCGDPLTMGFFVVPPVAELLRMTSKNTVSPWTLTNNKCLITDKAPIAFFA